MSLSLITFRVDIRKSGSFDLLSDPMAEIICTRIIRIHPYDPYGVQCFFLKETMSNNALLFCFILLITDKKVF
jgi:hypothetical protein